VRKCGVGLAAQHPGNLFDACFAGDLGQLGRGAIGDVLLGHDILSGGGGCDLRQMGNAEDLVRLAEAAHLRADGMGDLTAHVGIDFVKDEQGDAVLGGEGALDGEHHAGDFAAGGDQLEGLGGLARIRGEEKFGSFQAGGRGFFQGPKCDGEFRFFETEIAQTEPECPGQVWGRRRRGAG